MLNLLKKLKIFLDNHPKSFLILKNHNFYNIKAYKLSEWHKDTFYYVAKKSGTKFFIKISSDKSKIEREVNNNKLMSECLRKNNIVSMEDFVYSKDRSFILFEYINDSCSLTENNFEFFSLEIFKILKKINKSGFIHRDLRPENFLIVENCIKIIDFEFLTNLDFDKNMELDLSKRENLIRLLNCGSEYKKGNFIWNDFYSLLLISKKFNSEAIIQKYGITKYLNNSNYTVFNEKYKY